MPVVGGVFQPIAGLPQWANVRSPQPIGVAGSTGEVDWVAVNGLSGVVASGQFWDQGQAAQRRVARQTTRPASGRGDGAANRGRRGSEDDDDIALLKETPLGNFSRGSLLPRIDGGD